MNKICISCGGDIKPGALKCSFCGRFVEDVAVDESMIWTTVAPNSRAYGTQAQVAQAQVAQAQAAQAQAAQAQVAQAQTPSPAQNVKYGGSNIFADANWANAWAEKRANSEKLGIVLTDTRAAASVSPFLSALNDYIAHRSANGVNYFLLDLKDQQVLALNCIVYLTRDACQLDGQFLQPTKAAGRLGKGILPLPRLFHRALVKRAHGGNTFLQCHGYSSFSLRLALAIAATSLNLSVI
jgi:hypothetical protein